MPTQTTNPLFTIAKSRYAERLNDIGYAGFISNMPENVNTYTLGFCDGIAYYTETVKRQIEGLQRRVKELEEIRK